MFGFVLRNSKNSTQITPICACKNSVKWNCKNASWNWGIAVLCDVRICIA